MASVVEICNLALSLIGADNINSLSEATPQARACAQFYEMTRDGLLVSFPWHFATHQRALAEITNERKDLWAHAYIRPLDALKIISLRPGGDKTSLNGDVLFAYHAQGGVIYTDVKDALLLYTARLEDSSLFPPLFVNALACQLSGWLAMPITRSHEVQNRCLQMAEQATRTAQMADSGDENYIFGHKSEFVASRE